MVDDQACETEYVDAMKGLCSRELRVSGNQRGESVQLLLHENTRGFQLLKRFKFAWGLSFFLKRDLHW